MTLNKCTRIRNSRDNWKLKAVSRATGLRTMRKTIGRLQHRMERQRVGYEEKISRLEAENASLRAGILRNPPAVIDLHSRARIRVLCVMMVLVGIVSFRSVPRILGVLRLFGQTGITIPHFTSVIHWSLRAGVAIFAEVSPCNDPWLAIIDCSIDIGIRKALVVLRVRLSALDQTQGAIGLGDCECIGLKISTVWNGPLVKDALTEIFGKAGMPQAIIKDGGTDLNKGVRLYRETEAAKKVLVIDDVGHVAANALKAEFAKKSAFTKFLSIVRKGAARIRQTDLAWLLPPKIRTKGRFQGITALAEWAVKLLDLMGGQGRAKENSELTSLRRAFFRLPALRAFLKHFGATCLVVEQFLKLMKNDGLNPETCRAARALLKQLPERSKVRIRLLAWLQKHRHVQRKLQAGHSLLVSSDVIESLFGKFKVIIQRNPQAELNRLAYVIPLLCGTHTGEDIDRALRRCSHKHMLNKIEETIPITLRQQRYRVLDSGTSEVPEPGNPARLNAG